MEKDTKIVLSAVLLLLFTMVSFSFFDVTNDDNFITGNADLIQYQPDLIVEDAYFYDYNTNQIITTPSVGDILGVKVIVKNRGGTSAIYTSNYTSNSVNSYPAIMFDGQITKDGVGKLSLNHWISNLNSGETFTIETSSQPDLLKEGGLYCFNLNIDSYNNVAESDENNNLFTKCIQVGQVVQNPNPLPDLIVDQINLYNSLDNSLITNYYSNTQIYPEISFKNIGLTDTVSSPGFGIKWSFMKDGILIYGPAESEFGPYILHPGESALRKQANLLPTLELGATYCFEATVDNREYVLESNENNNLFTKCITVVQNPNPPPPPALPDLIVNSSNNIDVAQSTQPAVTQQLEPPSLNVKSFYDFAQFLPQFVFFDEETCTRIINNKISCSTQIFTNTVQISASISDGTKKPTVKFIAKASEGKIIENMAIYKIIWDTQKGFIDTLYAPLVITCNSNECITISNDLKNFASVAGLKVVATTSSI